jgi:hypothetical protein
MLPTAAGLLRTTRRCDDADYVALAAAMALIHGQRVNGGQPMLMQRLEELLGASTEPGDIARALAAARLPDETELPSARAEGALLDLGRTHPMLLGASMLDGDDRFPLTLEFPLAGGPLRLTVVPSGSERMVSAAAFDDVPELAVAEYDALVCALDVASLRRGPADRFVEIAGELLRGGVADRAWNRMLQAYELPRAPDAAQARQALLNAAACDIARAHGDRRLDDKPFVVDHAAAKWFGCAPMEELAVESGALAARLRWDQLARVWRGHTVLGDPGRAALASRPYAGTSADTLSGLALVRAREIAEQNGEHAAGDRLAAALRVWWRAPWRAIHPAHALLGHPHDDIRHTVRAAVFALGPSERRDA